jgi:hypothetical protein
MNQIQNPSKIPGALGQVDPLRLRAIEMVIVHGERVLTKQQPAIDDGLTDAQKVAAILTAMRSHGLIAS